MGASRRVSLWQRFGDREKIGLDTSVLVYYFNRHERYFKTCQRLVREIEFGRLRGVISVASEMEVLVHPLAEKRAQVVNDIQQLFRRLRWLDIVPVDRTLARQAAALRAETKLRSLDAIIATTALAAGCRYLVGNDREFASRIKGLGYIMLGDYV